MGQALSEHFTRVAVKRLAGVEVDKAVSNQHEFNGVTKLKAIFGTTDQRVEAKWIYLADHLEEPIVDETFLTWYDARANHPTRTEFRMYYRRNSVMDAASANDTLIIAQQPSGCLLVLVAEAESTVERQVRHLFELSDVGENFEIRNELDGPPDQLDFVKRSILETIGIETRAEGEIHLEALIQRFGNEFPDSVAFSAFARQTFGGQLDGISGPDESLVRWMEREHSLYRGLEKQILTGKLASAMESEDTVEEVLRLAMSTFQCRKSRAGAALENHLEELFRLHRVPYSRGARTEGHSRPDFMFPSIDAYLKSAFPSEKLFMLAAKTTCKDRWRQILTEANRIPVKHLCTLEPAISLNQTSEMAAASVQLVVPEVIQASYLPRQRETLMSVGEFIMQVKRQHTT